jgi:hypothetical protein
MRRTSSSAEPKSGSWAQSQPVEKVGGWWRMNRMSQRLTRLAFVSFVGLIVASCSAWVEGAHDWALTSLDGNVLNVVVAVGSGSCDRFEAIEVSETQTEVSITALVSEKEPGSGLFTTGCTADMGFEQVEVVLDRPVGDRALTGCAPGEAGLQDYFADPDRGRTSDNCAEIVDGYGG